MIWLLNVEIFLFFADQFSLRDNKYGVVQLRRYGIIGEFCDSFWTDKNSDVLCRQLGFGGGKAAFYSRINKKQITAPYLGSFDCNGTEKSLSQCTERDPFICYSSLAAGAVCYLYQGVSILCYCVVFQQMMCTLYFDLQNKFRLNIEFHVVPIYVLRIKLNHICFNTCWTINFCKAFYSTHNVIFNNPILSYHVSILLYHVCILFYHALILSYHALILFYHLSRKKITLRILYMLIFMYFYSYVLD